MTFGVQRGKKPWSLPDECGPFYANVKKHARRVRQAWHLLVVSSCYLKSILKKPQEFFVIAQARSCTGEQKRGTNIDGTCRGYSLRDFPLQISLSCI
jgi:hypothetical protein